MSRALLTLRTIADRDRACRWVRQAPIGSRVEFKAPRRSLPQSDKMWAMLTDIARQVDWYGQKLTPEDWKDVMSASLRKARVVPGLDGGFVPLGMRTSDMSKAEMSALIELIYAFGAERGVIFGGEAPIDDSSEKAADMEHA
jgi:NinB protein